MFIGDENEDDASVHTSKPCEILAQQPAQTEVDVALHPSFSKKPQMSAAQARFLDMQAKQHEAEMELLQIKRSNLQMQHKRKLEVLDAEFEYWDSIRKNTRSTQKQNSRPTTRAQK